MNTLRYGRIGSLGFEFVSFPFMSLIVVPKFMWIHGVMVFLFMSGMEYALRYSDKRHISKSSWEIWDTNSFVALTHMYGNVSLNV